MLKCQMSCNKSAWWGFASVTDRQRLQVLLQHDIRSGLCSPETRTTLTSLAESIDDAADALFQRIMHNPCHVHDVLHHLLPERRELVQGAPKK